MPEVLRAAAFRLGNWLGHGGVWWTLGLSIVMGVGTLAIATAVVVAWPANRFTHDPLPSQNHVVVRALAAVARNVLGIVLLMVGLVMALPGVPGQGVLTMIIGLTLVDFPGKTRIERRILKHPRILGTINKLRGRFDRAPIALD
jgi:hypothetical protein